MMGAMVVRKIAISLDPDLASEIAARAAAEGTSVSRWLAAAADREIRHSELREMVADYEAASGAITEEERTGVARLWRGSH